MKIKNVFRIIPFFFNLKGFVALCTWKPFSITSFYMLQDIKELNVPFQTIIDGGANVGQFARAASETFSKARIISFEPLKDVADQLKQNFKKSFKLQVITCALGAKNGKSKFYRNVHSHSSSVLPLHKNHKLSFPESNETKKMEVEMRTLDSVFKGFDLIEPVLLKLDLQGFELEALRGASKTLKKVKMVLLETSFKPMYKGESLLPEIKLFLKKRGFKYLKTIDTLEDFRGISVQMDVLFVREN